MVEQHSRLEEILAPEVAATLIDLAQLARRAGSAAVDAAGGIAHELLGRLLVLCAAQQGALLLGVDEYDAFEQPSPASQRSEAKPVSLPHPKPFRALALYGMGEEEVHALLTAFPSTGPHTQIHPKMTCWIIYRLSLGEFLAESEYSYQHSLSPQEMNALPATGVPPTPVQQPFHALLVIGWTPEKDSECALVIDKGQRVLPFVVDAVSSVIVSILLVERMHELEAASIRNSLQEMELLKAELLGTVSHELRSPLASIKGYAATLLRHERRLSREERHQFLLAINEASDRLEVIIERLLEISQLETGEVTIQRSVVDPARLAAEAIAALEERLAEQLPDRFTFTLSVEHVDGTPATGVPLILADQRRLREVLDNLLENAIKYSPGGGAIAVILRPIPPMQIMEGGRPSLDQKDASGQLPLHIPQRTLEILVCDNGMGIPVEHLERIFDRFHRVDTRLTREVNGLGLGLAICKRIIELHNGLIWAENRPKGQGSIFHVRLPIDEIPKELMFAADTRAMPYGKDR
ncbi:MAG TPA: ATP-binding protein [Ktedonobacteraceae bacterium]|nr:ATP-binding protein [Ktedonobacteraceae bacterium]